MKGDKYDQNTVYTIIKNQYKFSQKKKINKSLVSNKSPSLYVNLSVVFIVPHAC